MKVIANRKNRYQRQLRYWRKRLYRFLMAIPGVSEQVVLNEVMSLFGKSLRMTSSYLDQQASQEK